MVQVVGKKKIVQKIEVPVTKFDWTDSKYMYELFWKQEFAWTFEEYLLFNEECDWFIYIEGDLDIVMIGVKSHEDEELVHQIFREDTIIPMAEATDIFVPGFQEEFLKNYS